MPRPSVAARVTEEPHRAGHGPSNGTRIFAPRPGSVKRRVLQELAVRSRTVRDTPRGGAPRRKLRNGLKCKGRGARHQMEPGTHRAALRFAQVPHKNGEPAVFLPRGDVAVTGVAREYVEQLASDESDRETCYGANHQSEGLRQSQRVRQWHRRCKTDNSARNTNTKPFPHLFLPNIYRSKEPKNARVPLRRMGGKSTNGVMNTSPVLERSKDHVRPWGTIDAR